MRSVVGAALGAVTALHWGVEACLILVVIGFVAQFVVIYLSPVPRLADLPEAVDLYSKGGAT